MKKSVTILAVVLLQAGCAAGGDPQAMISFEQIGSEISVSHSVLREQVQQSAGISSN